MLHHVSIEVEPADIDRATEFWTLLGFAVVEPPQPLAGTPPSGSSEREPRST